MHDSSLLFHEIRAATRIFLPLAVATDKPLSVTDLQQPDFPLRFQRPSPTIEVFIRRRLYPAIAKKARLTLWPGLSADMDVASSRAREP